MEDELIESYEVTCELRQDEEGVLNLKISALIGNTNVQISLSQDRETGHMQTMRDLPDSIRMTEHDIIKIKEIFWWK